MKIHFNRIEFELIEANDKSNKLLIYFLVDDAIVFNMIEDQRTDGSVNYYAFPCVFPWSIRDAPNIELNLKFRIIEIHPHRSDGKVILRGKSGQEFIFSGLNIDLNVKHFINMNNSQSYIKVKSF